MVRSCECGACESALLRGLFEYLPKPGAVLDPERRRKWLALAENALDLEYPAQDPPPEEAPEAPAAERPALPAPVRDNDVEELEARPTAFNAKLAKRKKGRPPKQKATARGAGAVPPDAPKVKARDVVLKVLGVTSAPMTAKAIAEEASKHFDVSGFKDLRGAITFQVKRMDAAGEIRLADVEGVRNYWALP